MGSTQSLHKYSMYVSSVTQYLVEKFCFSALDAAHPVELSVHYLSLQYFCTFLLFSQVLFLIFEGKAKICIQPIAHNLLYQDWQKLNNLMQQYHVIRKVHIV